MNLYAYVRNGYITAALCCGRWKNEFPEAGAETVSTLIRLRCAAQIYLRIVTAARGGEK